jgi:hypothetical protein
MKKILKKHEISSLKKVCLLSLITCSFTTVKADIVQYFPESFQENLRATLDLSTRISHNDDTNNNHYQHVAGLDLHKVFSNDTGDWATLRAQLYVLRQENGPGGAAHPFLEGADDWELQPRILDVNFTSLGKHIPNIRIGHFEVPFGLEHLINTNGTLHDFRHAQNIGKVKPDWGIALNDDFANWEYEVGITRGTGIEYHSKGDPYIIAGRIGSARDRNFVIGASFADINNTRPVVGNSIGERERYGFDVQYYYDLFGALAEVSWGENNDGSDIRHTILELNWRSPGEKWFIWAQGIHEEADSAANQTESLGHYGIRFAPDSHWAFSAMWSHSYQTDGDTYAAQVRYRF